MNSTHTLAGAASDRNLDARTPRLRIRSDDGRILALVFSDAMEQGSFRILFKMVRIGRLG